MRTGLILLAPAAEPLVQGLRGEVPAHVTVLFPFRQWEAFGLADREALRTLLAGQPAIETTFTGVGRFPGVLWLRPEPRAPFDGLTGVLTGAYPDCRPYDGQFADPVPHLTALQGDEAALDAAEATLKARLAAPLATRLDSCSLFAETEVGWREMLRFPLAG